LHAHVVQGGGDGARAHGVGIAGVPAYLDWVCWRRKLELEISSMRWDLKGGGIGWLTAWIA
jgi:hypothetical protein